MAITKINNALLTGLTSDTKPTNYAIGTIFIDENGTASRWNGTAWITAIGTETAGTATAAGGSTGPYNIAHGLGVVPKAAFPHCSSHSIVFTYTTTSTNIVVTFASAPSGTVTFHWRAIGGA